MRRKAALLGTTGLFILVTSEVLMLKQIEPFLSWFYFFAWWSYILVVDSLVYLLKGNSLLLNRRGEFFLMLPWSTVIWVIFESFNLVLGNWYYVHVIDVPWMRWLGYSVAFATVLPGIFETTELLEALGLFKGASLKRIRVTRAWYVVSFAVGVVTLAAPLFFPHYCFPLIWGTFIFLLEPLNHRFGGASLLRDWEQGNPRKFLLLLCGGAVCGILWEFWNYWSLTKWVYTVPFFYDVKAFEMPVAGFLGFAPFAVECYVMYNFVSLFRHRRGWEQTRYTLHPERRVGLLPRTVCTLLLALFCVFVYQAMDESTVGSYWSDLRDLDRMDDKTAAALEGAGIRTLDQFIKAGSDGALQRALSRKIDRSEEEVARWVDTARLVRLKGLGHPSFTLLNSVGINTVSQLAEGDPEEIYQKVSRLPSVAAKPGKKPTEAMVRIWVEEARKSECASK